MQQTFDFNRFDFEINPDDDNHYPTLYKKINNNIEDILVNQKNIECFNTIKNGYNYALFFIDKNKYGEKQLQKAKKIMKNLTLARNINQDHIKVNIFDSFKINILNENRSGLKHYVKHQHDKEKVFEADNFTSKERKDMVDFLKEQNDFVMKNFLVSENPYSLFEILQIDLIFKLSEENEFGYFEKLFEKVNESSLKNLLEMMSQQNFYFFENDLVKKIIKQHVEHYGTENVEILMRDFNKYKSDSFNDLARERFSYIAQIVNEVSGVFYMDSAPLVEIKNNQIWLRNDILSMKIKNSLEVDELLFINEKIEEMTNIECFYNLNKTSIYVPENVEQIFEIYTHVFERISQEYANIAGRQEEMEKIIREAYLLVITKGISNQKRNKTKI